MSTVNGFQVGSETLKYNYESLDNYNTPSFSASSSKTYAVGDYVMYNGKLYKCTTATTGGTWVSGSWTLAVLSDDVSELNRQLSDVESALDSDENWLESLTLDTVLSTTNLFDAATVVSGKIIKNDGSEGQYPTTGDPTWSHTALFPAYPLLCIRKGATNVNQLIAFYDENADWLKTVVRSNVNVSGDGRYYIVRTPSEAKYCVVNFKSSESGTLMITPWFYPAQYTAYGETYSKVITDGNIPATIQRVTDNSLATEAKTVPGAINELSNGLNHLTDEFTDLFGATTNIFDTNGASSDGTVIKSDGTETTYANWSCTGFMPVSPGNKLYITKGASNVTTLIAFYTANDVSSFVVRIVRTDAEVSSDGTHYIVTVPDGATYARVNFKTSELNTFMVCPTFYPDEYVAYGTDYYNTLPDEYIDDTIQRATDNALLTTNKTVTGAINELYNGGGSGGTTPPWVISPSGSDDTAAIAAALTAYGYCQLTKGTFNVNNIDMPDGSTLCGMGSETKLVLSGSDSSAGYAVKMASRCTVQDLAIWGSANDITMAETLVNRHGILWEGTYDTTPSAAQPQRGTVQNVHIRNFKGGGITCRNTGTPTANCLNVSDCYINGCRAGINIAYSSEFHRFVNVHCGGCYYGCINNGGNNTFVNCGFSQTEVAFVIGSSDGKSIEPSSTQHDLSNLAHGSVIGCVFNHIDSDTTTLGKGDAIRIIGSTAGFVFSGCQFFYSKINIQDAEAIIFGDCLFGENRNDQGTPVGYGITLTNTDSEVRKTFFNNCVFKRQPVFTKTGTIAPVINACYLHDGTAVTDV